MKFPDFVKSLFNIPNNVVCPKSDNKFIMDTGATYKTACPADGEFDSKNWRPHEFDWTGVQKFDVIRTFDGAEFTVTRRKDDNWDVVAADRFSLITSLHMSSVEAALREGRWQFSSHHYVGRISSAKIQTSSEFAVAGFAEGGYKPFNDTEVSAKIGEAKYYIDVTMTLSEEDLKLFERISKVTADFPPPIDNCKRIGEFYCKTPGSEWLIEGECWPVDTDRVKAAHAAGAKCEQFSKQELIDDAATRLSNTIKHESECAKVFDEADEAYTAANNKFIEARAALKKARQRLADVSR